MKISITLGLLAFTFSDLAIAKTALTLNESNLNEIKASGNLSELRVHISKRIVLEDNVTVQTNYEIQSNEVQVKRHIKKNKIILPKNALGKILAIEERWYQQIDLYVTFDPDCSKRECAFLFKYVYEEISKEYRFIRPTSVPTGEDYPYYGVPYLKFDIDEFNAISKTRNRLEGVEF